MSPRALDAALHLAATFSCQVTGVDYSPDNVARASRAARDAGHGLSVTFIQGDAEQLDLASTSFDVVICECALCTFPNKDAAVRQFRCVPRPGGRVGISGRDP